MYEKFGWFGRDLPEHATLVLGDWPCRLISGASSWSRAGFQWGDPFMLNEHLIEDDRVIRDATRACAQMREFIGARRRISLRQCLQYRLPRERWRGICITARSEFRSHQTQTAGRKDQEAMLEQPDAEVTLY
jgi:hypothetical protein